MALLDNEDKALLLAIAVKSSLGPEPTRQKDQEFDDFKAELDEYYAACRALAEEIVDDSHLEYGFIGQTLTRLTDADKVFVVDEIVSVKLEQSSQRIVITGRSDRIDPKTKELKIDTMRTNRVDDFKFGSAARALGNKAKRMIGQRAQVKIRMEKMASGSGESARVIEYIRPLGKKRED